MKEYTSTEPVFSEKIPILETSDTTHADNVNVTTMQLLQNTVSNRKMIKDGMGDAGGYSSNVEYHKGEYCMYENVLYKCLQDTSGEWDPDCWQKTTAFGEICSLQNSIESLIGLFGRDEEGNMKSLGEAAFAGIANNRTTTEPGFAADARQLKDIQDVLDAQNSASEANIKAEIHSSTISFSDAYVGDAGYPIAALDYLAKNMGTYSSGAHSITSADSRGTGIVLCKLYGNAEYYVGILIPKYIGKLPLVFGYTSGTYSLLQFKWCTPTSDANT